MVALILAGPDEHPNTDAPTVRDGTEATDRNWIRLASADPKTGQVAAIDMASATSVVPCAAAVRQGPSPIVVCSASAVTAPTLVAASGTASRWSD